MLSTMPSLPLTVQMVFEHGRRVYPDRQVTHYSPSGLRSTTFGEIGDQAERLASGLRRLGVGEGDRVATYMWNNPEHLALYFAVPCMGAVLHTVNIRLDERQTAYVIDHGGARVLFVDASLAAKLAPAAAAVRYVETWVIVGDGDVPELPGRVLRYDEVIAEAGTRFDWPQLDENAAASMCYTSGTTGDPRGVAYGHRSTFVHALAQCTGSAYGISHLDTILLIVPMFHANAWGLPYAGWMMGADLILPDELLQAPHLSRMIDEQRPTFTAAVATIYRDLLALGEMQPVDLSCLRVGLCGGAPVPASLIEAMRAAHGVPILQGWGMTETSPSAAVAHPPRGTPPEEEVMWRTKSGRPLPGVQLRIVDEHGAELPWDGVALGELEVRGPWVSAGYVGEDVPEKFHDGWLRTGDVGTIDARGYAQITDRLKDVIKSGGEWISSVDLENTLMSHPDVVEAAVVAVPDERWDERPLACLLLREGAATDIPELHAWLAERVTRMWLPERWTIVEEVPKTSVGKFDKKLLRARYAEGDLDVEIVKKARGERPRAASRSEGS